MALVDDAGLTPATHEFFTFHVHGHLDIFVDGSPILVPGGIGIDITDPAVQSGTDAFGPVYGGIPESGCDDPCISPLHTHGADGVVHIESPKKESYTLGQLFTEWGVPLDDSCVGDYCAPDTDIAVYVNGEQQSGNPADIQLVKHDEIAIVIGTPPDEVPSSYAFAEGE